MKPFWSWCFQAFSRIYRWSEAKPIKDKSDSTIAQFHHKVLCQHGCIKIQINNQDKEFVNEVSKVLHKMIGTEQGITSSFHPESNGLCETRYRNIKDPLVKVLDGNLCDWLNTIEGVLFAPRFSKHISINFSPFFLIYNREPTLPIDVKYSSVPILYDRRSVSIVLQALPFSANLYLIFHLLLSTIVRTGSQLENLSKTNLLMKF